MDAPCPNCGLELEAKYDDYYRSYFWRCGVCGYYHSRSDNDIQKVCHDGVWHRLPIVLDVDQHHDRWARFMPLDEIALRAFKAYTRSLGVDPGQEDDLYDFIWGPEHEDTKQAWIAAVKAVTTGGYW